MSSTILAQKSSRTECAHMVAGVCCDPRWKSVTSISAFCTHLCPLLLNSHSLAPRRSLVLRKAKYPLPEVLQVGERFLAVQLRESPHPSILQEPYALFFLLRSPSLPVFTLQKWLPPLPSTSAFLFPSSPLQTSHLPHSLLSIVQIIFLTLKSIS